MIASNGGPRKLGPQAARARVPISGRMSITRMWRRVLGNRVRPM